MPVHAKVARGPLRKLRIAFLNRHTLFGTTQKETRHILQGLSPLLRRRRPTSFPDSLCTFFRLAEFFRCQIANHLKLLAVPVGDLIPRGRLAAVLVGHLFDAPAHCFPFGTFYRPPGITWRAFVSAVHDDGRLDYGCDWDAGDFGEQLSRWRCVVRFGRLNLFGWRRTQHADSKQNSGN